MESEGVKGRINVSQKARNYIDKASNLRLNYEFNKRVNITMKTGLGQKTDLSTDS